MNKKNIFFVSLMCIAALAGNGFCAKVQDNFKELKTNIAAFAKEDVKALGDVLRQEQQQSEVLDQVGAKLAKVKQQYPDSTKTIDAVFFAIKDLISRRGATPEFYAQNLITPLERDLSPALIDLRNQNSGAFYATMSVIDVKYPTQHGAQSISYLLDFVNGYLPSASSEIRDTDNLLDSLQADSYKDALIMLKYLQKQNPAGASTVKGVVEQFTWLISAFGGSKSNESFYGQNLEGALENLESNLRNIKSKDKVLFNSITGVINRKYTTKNGTSSIKGMVGEVDCIFQNLPPSAWVQDPEKILVSLDAYEK